MYLVPVSTRPRRVLTKLLAGALGQPVVQGHAAKAVCCADTLPLRTGARCTMTYRVLPRIWALPPAACRPPPAEPLTTI